MELEKRIPKFLNKGKNDKTEDRKEICEWEKKN
jgi:hypothetical protein